MQARSASCRSELDERKDFTNGSLRWKEEKGETGSVQPWFRRHRLRRLWSRQFGRRGSGRKSAAVPRSAPSSTNTGL